MSEGTIPIRRPINPPVSPEPAIPEQPKSPANVVSLPTKGWFYPEENPLSAGEVEIKQMTAREEDILANQELIRKGKVLDKLLQSILINKSINVSDILVPDKNAIFIGIRRLAYGDNYPVNIVCPNCGERSKVDINLGELKDREVDVETFPKGKNSFPFTLPKSQVKITYKLLNQRDDDSIDKELAGLRKVSKETTGELTTRLKYIITSVNGDESKEAIRKFVDEELLAVDSRSLREYMRDHTPDVDMHFDFKCPNSSCELERRLDIPVGASFLWIDLES